MSTPATRSPSSSPARPDGRAAGRGRRRAVVAGAATLVLVVVVAGLAVAGVFGGGSGSGGSRTAGSSANPVTNVTLTAGATSVEAPLLFTRFPDGVADQVMAALTKYVDDGIVHALRKGRADNAALSTVVDAGVTAQLAGADRGALVDEGLPAAVGRLNVTAPAIPITALVGVDGKAVIAIATVQLDVTGSTARGPIRITRHGDLQFAPDATGAWKLTGYDLTVQRDGKGVPKGAARSSGTTTAPGGAR